MNKSRNILKSIILLCFSIVVLAVFRFYSMLRPGALGAIYKEIIAGGIVLMLCFLNYFVLFPRLYLQRRFLAYLLATVFSAMVATILEIVLVFPQIKEFINNVGNITPQEYYTVMTISLFMRDLCFVFFIFLINLLESVYKENININFLLQSTDNLLLARKCNMENELVTVRIEDIVYCQQDQNYTYLYMVDGTSVYRNCSLKSLCELLTSSRAVRISRKILVFYRHIVSYENNSIYVDIMNDDVSLGFEITDAYRQQALLLLKNHCVVVNERESTTVSESGTIDEVQTSHIIQQTTKDATQASVLPRSEENLTIPQVLAFIQTHPNCKGSDITDHIHLSLSTVNRILAQLKKDGLIEYVGSKRTGGYKATGNRQ